MNPTTYELCEDAECVLRYIARKAGLPTGMILSEAIALLELLYEAKLRGNELVIVADGVPNRQVQFSAELEKVFENKSRPASDP